MSRPTSWAVPGVRAVTLLLLLVPQPAGAQAREPTPGDVFRFVDLADGVWAALVLEQPAAYAFANSLVVEGEEGVLVVDTQQSPGAARALITEIRRRTDRPVRWVVNTHFHGDHVYGNQAYVDAFPGVNIIAHEATLTEMQTEGRARYQAELAELPASIEARKEWLRSGLGPGGVPLSSEDSAAVRRGLALRQGQLRELETLRWTLPDSTFRDGLTIDLGAGRVVELRHLGPAHTAGDVVAFLPGEGVLAAGDLIEEGPPWLEGADLPGWAAALERLDSLPWEVMLPSHGGIQRDRELLRWQGRFLRTLLAEAGRVASLGGGPAQVVAGAALEAFRPHFASVGLAGQSLDAWLLRAAELAWALVDPAPPVSSRAAPPPAG